RPARRAVRRRGRSEARDSKNYERQFANGRELVNAHGLRGKSNIVPNVEPLSGARTMLGAFFQHPAKF
ncbi:MAG: hypothetical protein K0S79_2347, partial [Nitrospira sp.]|nr:hypothetical protein [Nitrospira sp.]